MRHANKIEVIWDAQDPSDTGWAWHAYDDSGEIGSGPVAGRQRRGERPSRRRVVRSLWMHVPAGVEVVYP